MAKDLLWEIGTEELPARFIEPAITSLKKAAEKKLKDLSLSYEDIKTAGTFRRLVLFIKGLAEKQEDREEEILGPSVTVGLTQDGGFSQALVGFAKKYGVNIEELKVKKTPKGEYFYLKRTIPGQNTEDLLPSLLLSLLKEIYFPKTMRWGSYELRFGRPIRWMVCLFGQKVIPIEIAGVKASNQTLGHRFLTPDPIPLSSADWEGYEKILENNYVVVTLKKRLNLTEQNILEVAKPYGIPEIDEDLLKENANLVEYPFPIVGKFSEEFLTLPEPLIITALKEHQRYFCLRNPEGNLLNYFIAVNNNRPRNWEIVKKGHERVTKARLEDAKFYFEKDLSQPLNHFLEKIKGIVYHVKCGTLWEKTQRLVDLSKYLALKLEYPSLLSKIEKTCLYAKIDAASEVVSEFPSLQGVMGKILLEHAGEKEVAQAVFEQYLPYPKEETLPQSFEGFILSLADKIDHLSALFGVNEKPSGEKDPYGLRRTAYGIVKLLIGKEKFLNLEEAIEFSLGLLEKQGFLKNQKALEEIRGFIQKRLEGEFLTLGFSKNILGVVLPLPLNPYDQYLRLKALSDFQERKDFIDLIIGFKRVAQLLKTVDQQPLLEEVEERLFQLEEEKQLYQQALSLRPILLSLIDRKDYLSYLDKLVSLKETIDKFFDKVFVMVEDEATRNNRLKVLKRVAELFENFGDFTAFI
ncbi:glycine--tRNA ligase subunit beta [Thermodesulfobacterium sp. TA1]|uniref:glycine--tRNA ligase subunit beta n=1 Tax=Thermodesulfobacterium sp. TA1 TaxID=2234087 RepID=UPI001232C770|nr:glycine--tRNA ligase subunit beta [Thermodesulfobacterium sp. TA1]QER41602.1 glycine--tRNA ligase subunit beta [Thermodesulfobacterium sp. TA1]